MKAVGLIAGAIALAAPLVCGAAPAAAPAPLFPAYRDICLNAGGDPAAALAKADATGWKPTPSGDLLPLGALSLTDGQQRERTGPGVRLRLAVGHATDPAALGLKPQPWRVCVVAGQPADPSAGPALQSWAKVPGMRDSNADAGSALFVIADPQSQARRSAEPLLDTEMQALVDQHRIVSAGVKTIGDLTILLYAAPGS